jgi:hypothetical protein
VGLVRNTKYYELREDFQPIGFFPIAQDDDPGAGAMFVLHSSGPVGEVMRNVKTAVAEVSPALGIEFRVISEQLRESLMREQALRGPPGDVVFASLVRYALPKSFGLRAPPYGHGSCRGRSEALPSGV